MAAPPVKAEPGMSTSNPHVKSEPGMDSPGLKMEDDDLYEDAGDLDTSRGDKPVWLVKLPTFLAERWKDLDDDEEITLGVVKIPPQTSDDPSKLKLVLERNEANGMDTPTEYDMRITNLEVTNTYVFTEKDMPGFENKNDGNGAKEGQPAIPQRLINQHKNNQNKDWKNQKFKPYTRKPISKRTALVGTARHEISMIPVYNDEYRKFQAERTAKEDAPKFFTRRMEDNAMVTNLLAPGTAGKGAVPFSKFVRPTVVARKPTDNKAHRMSEGDLQSRLFTCFQEHEYWTMKAFRAKLVQPEAFLKQILEEIAVMNKTGPFSGKWSLKPEYKSSLGAMAGGSSEAPVNIDDDEDMEDDEGEEMEDVPLGNM